MTRGLFYDPTVIRGEFGISRSHDVGRINIKQTWTNTGGFVAVCGAVFASGTREQKSRPS